MYAFLAATQVMDADNFVAACAKLNAGSLPLLIRARADGASRLKLNFPDRCWSLRLAVVCLECAD